MGVQLPSEPITRKERYLAKAAGQEVEIPAEPITREEAYLEAIANAGGGGGTGDYNDLSNQPQIGGNTLIGDKSASDLGLVAAETGKGLSTNDYTNTDKDIVGSVTATLAGKQDKTDSNLETTDKTVTGAVNELKNGLTSLLDAFSSLGLSVVNGKVCQTYKTN